MGFENNIFSKRLDSAKKQLKRTVVGAGMLATTAGTGESAIITSQAEKSPEGVKIEAKQGETDPKEKIETSETGAYEQKMAELREAVKYDKNEKIAISFMRDGKREMLVLDGEDKFGFISAERIGDLLKKSEGELEIMHTHPLTAYEQYWIVRHLSREAIDSEIKAGKIKLNPMPPSSADMIAIMQTRNFFGAEADRLKNKIIDPTGEWSISLDKGGRFIEGYLKVLKKFEKIFDGDFLKNELELTEVQLLALEKHKVALEKTHPDKRLEYLKSHQDTSEIGEKMEQKLTEVYLQFISREDGELFGKIFGPGALGFEISIGKDEKGTVQDFISGAKKLGISIEYKPFKK